jgi:molybdate transport system substrate-binding protein
VGLGVRKGAPRPRIDSVETFKQALLAAASIAHTTEGASGMYFTGLIDKLGIGQAVRAKAVTQPGGLTGELVIAGKAELAVQQVPELLAVPGIELVGPFPDEIQKIGVTAAGIFVDAAAPGVVSALIEFLTTPASAEVFRSAGFDPLF